MPYSKTKVHLKLFANLQPIQSTFKNITSSPHTVEKMKTQFFRGIWNLYIKSYSNTKFEVKILITSSFDGGSLLTPTTVWGVLLRLAARELI